MRPKSKPYTGVTGFTTSQEVEDALAVLPEYSNRLVMVGILASSKTIYWEPNKFPLRYPKPDVLGNIFLPHSDRHQMLNLVHFNTNGPVLLLCDLLHAQDLAGPHFDGFQLNLAWPDPEVLTLLKKSSNFNGKKIVLQCGPKSLGICEQSPAKIRERVREYDGLIDYVLVDPSGGLGKEFDISFARDCFRALQELENIGLGIAGGLSHNSLYRLHELLIEFPEFSIDAEGKLRDANDNLDVAMVQLYLKTADEMFHRYGHD